MKVTELSGYVIQLSSEHMAVVHSVQSGHSGMSGQSLNKLLWFQVLVCTEIYHAKVVHI